MSDITREVIVTAARRAAAASGAAFLSRGDFERRTKIGQYHIYRLFPEGGWSEVLQLAGLDQSPRHNLPISDDDLLAALHVVASELGRFPTGAQFNARASVSGETLRKRFHGWSGTKTHYRRWLEQHDPASPMLLQIQTAPQPQRISLPNSIESMPSRTTMWPKRGGVQYGPPMDFRGLRHEPANEQGVVYLFGMISRELGFLVEAIHEQFPDCVAKRSIDGKGSRWEQVLIEFEYRSSNFIAHNHDPDACDVIVCWDHDWSGCPLEVIELRAEIRNLRS